MRAHIAAPRAFNSMNSGSIASGTSLRILKSFITSSARTFTTLGSIIESLPRNYAAVHGGGVTHPRAPREQQTGTRARRASRKVGRTILAKLVPLCSATVAMSFTAESCT